jgi:transmembrane sensor
MNSNIPELIDKFFAGKCTAEETLMLDEWYYSYDAESGPDELLDNHKRHAFEALILERINNNILRIEGAPQEPIIERKPAKLRQMIYAVSGVAAMLLIATGIYFLRTGKQQASIPATETAALPYEQNKLMLTTSNGNRLYLDKGIEGLKEHDGAEIRIKENTITYHSANPVNALAQNVLNVPTGRTYKVNLSDGTAVWLNNVSELTYPVSFGKSKDRVVALKGEAYFEVFHDASRPFRVKLNGTEITVLGTKFNVNTFQKGSVTTTLLEGSVRVSGKPGVRLLKPGQQAIADASNISISTADLQKAIAWKNGYFRFKEEGIETILGEVARWYNVEVKYSGTPSPGLHYSGKISRSEKLEEVLIMLGDITGLKLQHIGNTLLVNNK